MKGDYGMQHEAKAPFPCDAALAVAYVRWQELQEVYEPIIGLCNGTIFPELNKPFYGRRARCG